jgi:hypothetical protein
MSSPAEEHNHTDAQRDAAIDALLYAVNDLSVESYSASRKIYEAMKCWNEQPSSDATNDERCRFRFPDKAECSVLRGEHHNVKSHSFAAPKAVATNDLRSLNTIEFRNQGGIHVALSAFVTKAQEDKAQDGGWFDSSARILIDAILWEAEDRAKAVAPHRISRDSAEYIAGGGFMWMNVTGKISKPKMWEEFIAALAAAGIEVEEK